MQPKRFCFIGHVDSGKSSCAGHLLTQCGHFSDHELKQNEQECQQQKYQIYSRLLDIFTEEREKGKTHEFTTIDFNHLGKDYQIVDTPGHKTFIRELIKGVSIISPEKMIGCLMISAKEGEFKAGWEKGQTKEDIIITRSVGINKLIVLINKMDTNSWNQEIFNNIKSCIDNFIKKCSFKFVSYIPISAYSGIGLINTDHMPDWHYGKSLIETIDEINDENINEEIFDVKSWKVMLINLTILWCPNIISPGFKFILHYSGSEYEVVVNKIIGKNYAKTNDTCQCIINSNKIIDNIYKTRRIIARYENNTIGFGKIIKVN